MFLDPSVIESAAGLILLSRRLVSVTLPKKKRKTVQAGSQATLSCPVRLEKEKEWGSLPVAVLSKNLFSFSQKNSTSGSH